MKKLFAFSIFFSLVVFSFVLAEDASPVPEITINFVIRDGSNVIFSGSVPFPEEGVVDLSDNAGMPHSINSRSVLSVLSNADLSSSDFSISNLEYYSSFNSLYLKCITGAATGEKCDNWQYTVDNTYPGIGMDQKILSGGESVYLYFGPQYRVILSPSEITTADILTVTSEEYNYQDNTWGRRSRVTVGLTQPNPDNPWSPIEAMTGAADSEGQTTFSSIPAGSYNVGIKEDFYFPTESLTVTPGGVVGGGSMTVTPPPISGGAVGGGSIFLPRVFSVTDAVRYLTNTQAADGSFGNESLYTDWASIALAAGDVPENIKTRILNYMSLHNVLSVLLTDNERRAMVLLALGQDPYSFNGVNYIKAITDTFNNGQFGDTLLVNDDVFALIALASAGFTADDDIISKSLQFILAKQKTEGSWEESIDLSAAAVQALKPFDFKEGIGDALRKASSYLASRQSDDGGWGNVYSTSWAMQAARALGTEWVKNGKSGIDYLAANQMQDGGMLPESDTLQNRIWATSYAIPAGVGKPWSAILHPVSKAAPVLVTEVVEDSKEEPPIKEESLISEKEIASAVIISKVSKEIKTETEVAPVESSAPIKDEKNITPIILETTVARSGAKTSLYIATIGALLGGTLSFLLRRKN